MRQIKPLQSNYISSKQQQESLSPTHLLKRNKLKFKLLNLLQPQSPKNLTIKNPLFEIVPLNRKYTDSYLTPNHYSTPKQRTLQSVIIKSQLVQSKNLDITPKKSPKCINIHTQRRFKINS